MVIRSYLTREEACAKECGNWFNPFEWPCYAEKTNYNCGGSTTAADLLGSGKEDVKSQTYYDPATGKVVVTEGGGVDCKHECGSFLNPMEWGCYKDKFIGACGGSTGICDIIGGGEGCLTWAPWIIIGVVGLLLVLFLFSGGKRRR